MSPKYQALIDLLERPGGASPKDIAHELDVSCATARGMARGMVRDLAEFVEIEKEQHEDARCVTYRLATQPVLQGG